MIFTKTKEGIKIGISETELQELPAIIGYRYAREAIKESYKKKIPLIILLSGLSEKIIDDIFGIDPIELTNKFFKDKTIVEVTLQDLVKKDFEFVREILVFIGMLFSQVGINDVEELTEELRNQMMEHIAIFAQAAQAEALSLFGGDDEEDCSKNN